MLASNSVPESKKLMPIVHELASLYPSTKFVSIVSDHCIENYPDKNVPTMIIYRKGQMMGQVVGLGAMNGMKATLRGPSRALGLPAPKSLVTDRAPPPSAENRRRARPVRLPRHRFSQQSRLRHLGRLGPVRLPLRRRRAALESRRRPSRRRPAAATRFG